MLPAQLPEGPDQLLPARQVQAGGPAIRAALEGRRAAGTADEAAFVDADIAFHAAVVTAAHNPVLADLFAELSPVLREGLIEPLSLTGLRADAPDTGDEAHEALVRAVAEGGGGGAAGGGLEDPFAPAGTRGPE
ncbi:FCD domain-containing protein [Streptomyces coeruleorubidus]|uniref:FCD domain-containing protein n=1 Tax=Streptomyces coeruleorubidus TaxID=116188 RepID=UPI0036BDD1F8